jgi:glycine dehydrogenase subunit 1
MRYIPHTEHDIGSMLAVLGLQSVDELFAHLPHALRAQAHIDLPPGLSEVGLRGCLTELAGHNLSDPSAVFLGAGEDISSDT